MTGAGPDHELVLLPSLRASPGRDGRIVMTRKFLNGVDAYARVWPGPVHVLAELSEHPTDDLDHTEIDPRDPAARVTPRPGQPDALAARLQNAAAVLGFLSPYQLDIAARCAQMRVPLIFTSEYSPRTEKQIVDAGTRNPLLRWRRKLWIDGAERKRIAALRIAAGIQCSGTPAFEHYRPYNDNALLFFDNRVPVDDVIDAEALERKLAALEQPRPLRLVFGGRLIAMKGVLELPRIAAALRRRGVAFTLDIYGAGQLEQALRDAIRRQSLQDLVTLRGVVDFATGWIPLLKQQADLFVCPHPQGDPSSTYPEVMSCGVPIVGYANEAFEGVVRESGSGWLCPMQDAEAMGGRIASLSGARTQIAAAARLAREFARQHAFEITFTRRARHLIDSSRLPGSLKSQGAA
ncbi:MAG: glycosyltransferase [Steroidobacteraceae bacterium]